MSLAYEASLMAGRNLRRFLRSPALIIGSLITPLLLMFMMLALLGSVIGTSGGDSGYIGRLGPLIVLSTASMGASLSSVDFLRDLRGGMLDRFRTMPVRTGSVLVGRVTSDLTRGLLTALVATLVALLPGFRFTEGPLAVFAYFGVFLLFATMMSWIAIWVATVCTTETGPQNALNAPTMLLFFLSSGFVPVTAFPDLIQPIVRANPLSTADNALIGLSTGGPVAVPVLQTAAWTLGVGLLCAALSIRRFRSMVDR
jgi:ABC-2 type transport system permease protein